MKIAWCTPFSSNSSIGRFSSLLVNELRTRPGMLVDIWYPEGVGGRTWPDPGAELTKVSRRQLTDYDAVIYNVGDHAPNHLQLVKLNRRYPGIVILHDLSLNNLGLTELIKMSSRERRLELRRWYGSDGPTIADDIESEPGNWASEMNNILRYPLTELAVNDALAVVTHSEFAAAGVRERWVGDVFTLPLPAVRQEGDPSRMGDLSALDSRAVILQSGVVNSNKCIDTVIEGFAKSGVADRAQLVIAGYAEPRAMDQLRRVITANNVRSDVVLLGPVSDATLHELRSRAIIATALRHPCLEAASSVLLDSMVYGSAVVTVNSGHYVEVPDDVVVRIPVPPSAADVARVFRELVDDPDGTAELGRRAQEYVNRRYTDAVYVDELLRVIHEAGGTPRRRDLAAHLAGTLERIGFAETDPIAETLARTAFELFSPEPRRARALLY